MTLRLRILREFETSCPLGNTALTVLPARFPTQQVEIVIERHRTTVQAANRRVLEKVPVMADEVLPGRGIGLERDVKAAQGVYAFLTSALGGSQGIVTQGETAVNQERARGSDDGRGILC